MATLERRQWNGRFTEVRRYRYCNDVRLREGDDAPAPNRRGADDGCVVERGGPSRPSIPTPCALIGDTRWLVHTQRLTASGLRVLSLSRASLTHKMQPALCGGRDEGTT